MGRLGAGLQRAHGGQAVEPRHLDVEQHQVRRLAGRDGQGLVPIGGHTNAAAMVLQEFLEMPLDIPAIIRDQDQGARAGVVEHNNPSYSVPARQVLPDHQAGRPTMPPGRMYLLRGRYYSTDWQLSGAGNLRLDESEWPCYAAPAPGRWSTRRIAWWPATG